MANYSRDKLELNKKNGGKLLAGGSFFLLMGFVAWLNNRESDKKQEMDYNEAHHYGYDDNN